MREVQYETSSFGVDVLVCPHCSGRRKLLAFLTDPIVIARILDHLGLSAHCPAAVPARSPPGPAVLRD